MCKSRNSSDELSRLLPDTIEGWRTQSPDRVYDPENIYKYLNGGAELYLSYNFRSLLNRTYTRSGQPDIIVDIFDMGSSGDAFGAFSHSRESVQADYGQGSEYYEGFLLFWRDRYLVSIVASPETEDSQQTIHRLAGTVSESIGRDGLLPAVVHRLPEAGLNVSSIRYIRNYIWMNTHLFIADENILDIDKDTEAVVATYGESPHYQVLLLIEYPNNERANQAEQNFKQVYLPDLNAGEVLLLEDDTWAAIRRVGSIVGVVLNASQKDPMIQLLDKVEFEP
ncbi:DUF6599 family protein [Candidatus Neomarinimicrobiota bacterium]